MPTSSSLKLALRAILAFMILTAAAAYAQQAPAPPSGVRAAAGEQPPAATAPVSPASRRAALAAKRCAASPDAGSGSPATPAAQTFINKLTGRPDAKEDGAQPVAFPVPPGPGGTKQWLDAHNGALHSILQTLYPNDIRAFDDKESTTCSRNLYCEITFRQQALAYALAKRSP